MAAKAQSEGGLLEASALPPVTVSAAVLTPSAFGTAPASTRSVWKEASAIVRERQVKRLESNTKLTPEEKTKRADHYAEQVVSDFAFAIAHLNKRIFDHYPVCAECRGQIEAEAEVILVRAQATANRQWEENQAAGERYRAEVADRQ